MNPFITESIASRHLTMRCGDRLFHHEGPAVMGIINVTADSFYEGSRVQSMDALVDKAGTQLEEGACILDVGVMSSRPGADELPAELEAEQLSQVVGQLAHTFPAAFISADCYRASVAQAALDTGAAIINDIGGGRWDDQMFDVVARSRAGYVLMHSQSKPASMTGEGTADLHVTIHDYFDDRLAKARNAGVNDIWIDPGIGFGKTVEQNFALLKHMQLLGVHGCPVLVGLSRKSFIFKTLAVDPADALTGTIAMHVLALQKGASILRVHDVKEAVQTIKLMSHV